MECPLPTRTAFISTLHPCHVAKNSPYRHRNHSSPDWLFGNRSSMELGNLVQSNRVGVRAVGNSRGSQVCGTKWSNNRIRLQRVKARQLEVQPRVR